MRIAHTFIHSVVDVTVTRQMHFFVTLILTAVACLTLSNVAAQQDTSGSFPGQGPKTSDEENSNIYPSLKLDFVNHGEYETLDTANTVYDCVQRCKSMPQCNAITYDVNKVSGTYCYILKRGSYKFSMDPGWITWFKPIKIGSNLREGYQINYGFHYNDYAHTPVDCVRKCQRTPDCRALTYDSHVRTDGMNCFLYTGPYNIYPDPGWWTWEKYLGNDISNAYPHLRLAISDRSQQQGLPQVTSESECITKCKELLVCTAITYDTVKSYANTSCYLSHILRTSTGIHGSNLLIGSQLRSGYTLDYGFHWKYLMKSPADCVNECNKKPTCRGIAYDTNPRSERSNCYLRTSVAYVYQLPGWMAWEKPQTTS